MEQGAEVKIGKGNERHRIYLNKSKTGGVAHGRAGLARQDSQVERGRGDSSVRVARL